MEIFSVTFENGKRSIVIMKDCHYLDMYEQKAYELH